MSKKYTCTICNQVKEGTPAKEWFNMGELMEASKRKKRGMSYENPFNKECKDCYVPREEKLG